MLNLLFLLQKIRAVKEIIISLFNIRIKPDGRYLKGAGTYRVVDRNNKYSFIVTKDGMVKDKNRNIVENAC